jgi:micrococcal nuclease
MKPENKLFHYKAKVTRVVDGDTIDCLIDMGFDLHNKQRVRFYGVNTPETRTRDKEEKIAGLAAKEYVKAILKEGGNNCVIETRLDKKGKFGRTLGVIYVDGLNLNSALVKDGHAVRYYGGKRKK